MTVAPSAPGIQGIPVAVPYRYTPAAKKRGKAKEPPRDKPDPLVRRETLELVRAYYKIEDADVRKRVYQLITGLGAADA